MTDDDDATPEERAEAARLARLTDALLAGEPAPPVLPAEDRALLQTAAFIRAAGAPLPLPAPRRDAILAAVFRRRRAVVPWLVAAMAVAAALALALRPPRPPAARTPDALVGRIAPERAADARARLDVVYADRLAGMRDRLWGAR
jgi:hypothetical protein